MDGGLGPCEPPQGVQGGPAQAPARIEPGGLRAPPRAQEEPEGRLRGEVVEVDPGDAHAGRSAPDLGHLEREVRR